MNSPIQLVDTQIVRNAEVGSLRQFRLSADIQGMGRAGELITLAVTPADTADQPDRSRMSGASSRATFK
jgi:hypothetical protein